MRIVIRAFAVAVCTPHHAGADAFSALASVGTSIIHSPFTFIADIGFQAIFRAFFCVLIAFFLWLRGTACTVFAPIITYIGKRPRTANAFEDLFAII